MGQFEPKCGAQLIVGFGLQWMESCSAPVLSILSFYLYTCLLFTVCCFNKLVVRVQLCLIVFLIKIIFVQFLFLDIAFLFGVIVPL